MRTLITPRLLLITSASIALGACSASKNKAESSEKVFSSDLSVHSVAKFSSVDSLIRNHDMYFDTLEVYFPATVDSAKRSSRAVRLRVVKGRLASRLELHSAGEELTTTSTCLEIDETASEHLIESSESHNSAFTKSLRWLAASLVLLIGLIVVIKNRFGNKKGASL